MSMTEVIESIEKSMWKQVESRSVPNIQPETINIPAPGKREEDEHGTGSKNNQ